ncbi:hypothetical protein [Rubrimonas cliftonensis]|uniref:Uncharacterized protein n=1 Tax=Rubrimonas cliftonensis TaxID=89524 RepID=A0A1H4GA02_9RHOB|nr:hypothetical protein [Rubrimonas cliftonensis]SEB06456.1 hypothetical protein SAMN05444370_1464 [Rubrimonas cliftonensis]
MNIVTTPHAFAAPERLRALRLEAAMARKARHVNLGLLVRQHEDSLRSAAQRCDHSARAALHRLIVAVETDDRWTPATARDLRAAVRGLSASIGRLAHAPETAEALAWLRDRIAEIAAQDARVTALDAVLAAHWPAAARQVAGQPARRGRRR